MVVGGARGRERELPLWVFPVKAERAKERAGNSDKIRDCYKHFPES